MKSIYSTSIAFLGGCAMAGLVWSFAWPKPDRQTEALHQKYPSGIQKPLPAPISVGELLSELAVAKTEEARLAAAHSIKRLTSAELREALEQETLIENRQLTFSAKVLMIRWAEKDGHAATDWAWKRFRGEGLWNQAFREIGPAWASHNPAVFAAWVLESAKQKPHGTLTKDDGFASDVPLLDFENLSRSASWLISEDPHAAYEVLIKRGGFSSDDGNMADGLKSVAQVEQALSAFDNLEQIKPGSFAGSEIHIFPILGRWQELDPEGFQKSPLSRLAMDSTVHAGSTELKKWNEISKETRIEQANQAVVELKSGDQTGKVFEIVRQWAAIAPDENAAWMATLPEENRSVMYRVSAAAGAPRHLAFTLEQAEHYLPTQREACRVAAFDAWTKAHPGEHADRGGWPVERVTAWEDLEALLPEQND